MTMILFGQRQHSRKELPFLRSSTIFYEIFLHLLLFTGFSLVPPWFQKKLIRKLQRNYRNLLKEIPGYLSIASQCVSQSVSPVEQRAEGMHHHHHLPTRTIRQRSSWWMCVGDLGNNWYSGFPRRTVFPIDPEKRISFVNFHFFPIENGGRKRWFFLCKFFRNVDWLEDSTCWCDSVFPGKFPQISYGLSIFVIVSISVNYLDSWFPHQLIFIFSLILAQFSGLVFRHNPWSTLTQNKFDYTVFFSLLFLNF